MKPLMKTGDLCMVIVYYLMLLSTAVSGSQCSCYTFYSNTTKRDYDVSRKGCKANGGDLVMLEEEAEWKFITTQIQTRTTSSGHNQWWIGLTRKNGVWRWLNGYNLTYSKWKTGLDVYSDLRSHAIIEKIQGTLWNSYWYNKMGSICEKKGSDCPARQVKWCDIMTTTSITTLRDETTVRLLTNKNSHDAVQTIYEEPTTGHTTTQVMTISSEKADDKKVASRKLEGSMVIIIVIATVVLLAIIGIMIYICISCRKKPNDKDEQQKRRETKTTSEKEQEKLILQHQSSGIEKEPQNQACIYAVVNKKKTATEPEYAAVQKPPKKRQEELNYAVLSDFKHDNSNDIVKPPEYKETEYAILNV